MLEMFEALHAAHQKCDLLIANATHLTARQFTVLRAIAAHPRLTQKELVALTGIDRSTASNIVTRLAHQGLVLRPKSVKGARARTLELTTEGKETLRAALGGIKRLAVRLQKKGSFDSAALSEGLNVLADVDAERMRDKGGK